MFTRDYTLKKRKLMLSLLEATMSVNNCSQTGVRLYAYFPSMEEFSVTLACGGLMQVGTLL